MNLVCVLARAPEAGIGKSRLRARLGEATTDRLAGAFVTDVLRWAEDAADSLLVCHTGPVDLLPPARRSRATVSQVNGDLGDRIVAAVDAGFELGAHHVVIVGTDCPTLPASLLQLAFSELDHAASTLIPARDGGWIALGVDRPLGGALAGVTWSSAATASDTIAALGACGRPPRVLPPWYDLDEPGDLKRLRGDEAARERAPHTWAALADLRVPLP
jgi:rSAM/selenodomain-associated transferase 1